MSNRESRMTVAPTSSGKVMWAIAVAESPATIEEVAEILDANVSAVHTQVKRLYRSDCLARRKRHTGEVGGTPYEYEVLRP